MSSTSDSSTTLPTTLSAISTLIGYIGTEVATPHTTFHRILWPQRAYNNFQFPSSSSSSSLSLRNIFIPALLMPLGGPLHTAALKTIDQFFARGLFLGPEMGGMLGTAFFPDQGGEYHLPGGGVGKVRNGVWVRVLERVGLGGGRCQRRSISGGGVEGGKVRKVRQKTWVNRLVLSVHQGPGKGVKKKKVVCVEGDVGPMTGRILAGIVLTEITGIGVAIAVAVVWRSAWMVLWVVPLVLKLVSAGCWVPREGVVVEDGGGCGSGKETKRYMVTSGHGFQIIEGPPQMVQQFFRHYGHPRRSRWQELVQIAVVIAFGLNFPVGLVVSTMWMPIGLQCVWTGYVLYVTMVMYVSRYAHGEWWLTTEERLADALIDAEEHPGEVLVLFKGGEDCTLAVELTRTVHNSYGEAKEHALLLRQPPLPSSDHPGDVQSEGSTGNSEKR
ncbi:uncharacterized protein BO80DRAFT_268266 [Aspergillus ibericus CBS 121593]|uniref:Uncharacterized protein n=1 Tax=Aspergillus ibericus CBS 121593 TaxID=1448316 RepID=A0A395H716_9EURO|nr:hypothetical protein BO80DRAFT_268266 [Aspergillus ibericus CBS 121593]RAL03707.1 hypothetical protein BO80DRAFT_268266 [Aspergillus ibericus CBS 121593]